jgi:FtsH-binding integral membrane protein
MRKVYSLLSIQLAITTVIGATLLLTPGVKEMVQVTKTTFVACLFLLTSFRTEFAQ